MWLKDRRQFIFSVTVAYSTLNSTCHFELSRSEVKVMRPDMKYAITGKQMVLQSSYLIGGTNCCAQRTFNSYKLEGRF